MAIRLTFHNTFEGPRFFVKRHILVRSCSVMHGNTVDFGFPSLSEDPFSSSPLDKDELDLLVGRHGMFEELERKITFKSADRMLLVGEFGSGKTSFMQCLGARTNLHLSIDRIALSEPGIELLKDMYAQLIDGSPPHDYQKLSRDLQRMLHDSRQMLPLITIDADMADVSSLEVCLRSSLPFFERLPALILIAINPRQQSLISEQLLQRFEVRNMASLDIDGIKALVERRIAKASSQPYSLTSEDANRLLQMSQTGQPGAIIRVLRHAVSGNYVAPQRTEPVPMESLPEGTTMPLDEVEVEQNIEPILDDVLEDAIEDDEDEPDSEDWEETPGMTQTTGFDLDFGILDEPVEEPLEILDEDPEEAPEAPVDDAYVTEESLPFSGVFGGLRNRRRIVNNDLESAPEGQFKATEKGTAFWSAEESNLPEEIVETSVEIPDEYVPEFDGQIDIDDEVDLIGLQEIHASETVVSDSATIETFARLLSQLIQPSNQGIEGDGDLVDRLRALSRPRFAQKEEHVLDVAVLSSLTSSESIVVAEAKKRNLSPSDNALLKRLSIKRARLSQICNRLHKAGILHARMVGRSRMFGLTRSALAQLIAWGLVGGDE